jgi:hypothetical protein
LRSSATTSSNENGSFFFSCRRRRDHHTNSSMHATATPTVTTDPAMAPCCDEPLPLADRGTGTHGVALLPSWSYVLASHEKLPVVQLPAWPAGTNRPTASQRTHAVDALLSSSINPAAHRCWLQSRVLPTSTNDLCGQSIGEH